MKVTQGRSIRQGDILLVRISKVKGKLCPIPRDYAQGIVLAEGEATGHFHHLLSTDARLLEPEPATKCQFLMDNGSELLIDTAGGGIPRVLEVAKPTVLLHYDHGICISDGVTELQTPIDAGTYVVIRQRERSFSDIEGYRRVSD